MLACFLSFDSWKLLLLQFCSVADAQVAGRHSCARAHSAINQEDQVVPGEAWRKSGQHSGCTIRIRPVLINTINRTRQRTGAIAWASMAGNNYFYLLLLSIFIFIYFFYLFFTKRLGIKLDGVYASTAVRARETAQIVCNTIGAQLDGEEIPLHEQLEELSQGNYE